MPDNTWESRPQHSGIVQPYPISRFLFSIRLTKVLLYLSTRRPCVQAMETNFRVNWKEWVWVKPVCPKAAHERHWWKELPVHKRNMCLSHVDLQDPLQKLIIAASMPPNCNHLVQPVPIPPDVYTGRTFAACRFVWRFSGGPLRSMPLGSPLHEKNVRRSFTETWWFVRIERFAWKARDAACKRCCRSALGFPPWAACSMHPSHLWAHQTSSISTVTPPLVCKEPPGWFCVVKIFVFDVLSFKPTWPRDVTNSSKSRMVSSWLVANTKRSSANPRSRPSCHHVSSNHMFFFLHAMVDKIYFWVVHLLVMLVLAFVLPKHCPVTCWMLHSMHIRKGFAPYTCHLDTGNLRFLQVSFLLHGLRMLMLKVYINCWICSSRIAGNPELLQS